MPAQPVSPSALAIEENAPEGFAPISSAGFSMFVGPLFWRIQGKGLELGFRVTPEKCNGMDTCHGGMIATLMDMQLALGARANEPRLSGNFLPTISLQLDFLAAPTVGDWVSGETEVLRVTRRMVFVQGMARTDNGPVARASAILKIGGDAEGGAFDIRALLSKG